MKLTRRSVIAGTAAFGAVTTFNIGRALAADYQFKVANVVPLDNPLSIGALRAADRIREETGGRVELRLFPSNQLGADTDVLSQVRSGAVEFMMISGEVLSILVPSSGMYAQGFAFNNYDQVWKVMDGGLGQYIRSNIEGAGLHVMTNMWDNGFRQLTSNRPIETPKDLEGFKIRVPVSPVYTSLFTALGASPTGLNFAEVYSALETGILDGQENPLVVILTSKLYEVQKYCTLTNHLWAGVWWIGNRRVLDNMPADLREIVERNINEAALYERSIVANGADQVLKDLRATGLNILEPDMTPFREKLRQSGYYQNSRATYGEEAWALLEEGVGSLS